MSGIVARVENGLGRLSLDRPRALHALDRAMCEAMTEALLDWRGRPDVVSILIDHVGERGFCAGGDIRMIAESGAGDGAAARGFFRSEYRLNHLLFHYPKPVTAIVDGIVMGGGVGISGPARLRIATERTVYAMPETGIGLFPDVGASWVLPRLPGEAGTWIGLTGARLKAADTVALGLHTHFVPSDAVEALKAALIAEPADPGTVTARFAQALGCASLAPHRSAIDRLFSGDTVEAVIAALRAEKTDWAREQLALLETRSPQSLKITLRLLRAGAGFHDFAEALGAEYGLTAAVVASHDFQEGVRALILDKDKTPQWSPATLEQASSEQLDALFDPSGATDFAKALRALGDDRASGLGGPSVVISPKLPLEDQT